MYESTRTVQYPKPRIQALADVQRVLERVGKVDQVNDRTSMVSGHCRVRRPYPMTVKVAASVLDGSGSQSVVQVNAYGSDIWAVGARKALDRFLAGLETEAAHVGPE